MEKVIMPKRPQFWRVVLKNELENMALALDKKIDGLIISPINSSTAATLLKLQR